MKNFLTEIGGRDPPRMGEAGGGRDKKLEPGERIKDQREKKRHLPPQDGRKAKSTRHEGRGGKGLQRKQREVKREDETI